MLTRRRCRLVHVVLDVVCVAPNPSLPVAAVACVRPRCWDLISLPTSSGLRRPCFSGPWSRRGVSAPRMTPGTFLNRAVVPLEAPRCSACSRPQMCSFLGRQVAGAWLLGPGRHGLRCRCPCLWPVAPRVPGHSGSNDGAAGAGAAGAGGRGDGRGAGPSPLLPSRRPARLPALSFRFLCHWE